MNTQEKKKILVVDDTEINRSILSDMLSKEFEILEAGDGVEAISCLHEHEGEIALVLLDIIMPRMDGFEMLQVMNDSHWIEQIPVIMISAETYSEYVDRAYDLGVIDYISRPFDGRIVLRRVQNTIMLYAKQQKLVEMIERQVYEKEKNSDLMVEILSHIVEFRNGESGAHVLHIRTLTELLLKQLTKKTDQYHLSNKEIHLITNASALHDIGKIVIPEHIINKPGKLTSEEFEIMKTHTIQGAKMLENISFREDEPLIQKGKEICLWHHERYDGQGYPDGLKGDEIPIGAQVVSLADVYDALTSVRVYKPAYSHEQAMHMILDGECGTFHPILIECLLEVSDHIARSLEKGELSSLASSRDIQTVTMDTISLTQDYTSLRTLRLLEHERIKYQFFASMSHEVQFEYTAAPNMVVFNTWGANYLGLKEAIIDPLHDLDLINVMGNEVLREIHDQGVQTNPEAPIFEKNYLILVNGQKRWHKLTLRTLWGDLDGMMYQGLIGKLVDVHEELEYLNELETIAGHDFLTGLYNSRYAKEYIEKRLSEDKENTYALLLLDLDDFKQANDRYGHLFGDCVLKEEADKMRSYCAGKDTLLARVGGDEFMVFLACSRKEETILQHLFTALLGEYLEFSIQISMGVAFCQHGDGYEEIFHQADQALYYSKKIGKNRFSIYDQDLMAEMLSVLSPIDEN